MTSKWIIQKKLKNNKNIFLINWKKIVALEGLIQIVITQRGTGKTLASKIWVMDEWLKNGRKFLFIKNEKTQIDLDKIKFLSDPQQFGGVEWLNCKVMKDGVIDVNGNYFIYFGSLATAHQLKGARDSNIYAIIYDEFNEGLSRIGRKQTALLEKIVQTFRSVEKIFIFGNNITGNNPLLNTLQIYHLDREFQKIEKWKKLHGHIIIPQIDKNLVERELSGDKVYEFSKLMNQAEHSYYNENFDNVDGILELDITQFKPFSSHFVDSLYFDIYLLYNETKKESFIFVKNVELPFYEKNLVVIKRKEIDISFKYADMKKGLIYLFENNRMFFDNIISKRVYIESL